MEGSLFPCTKEGMGIDRPALLLPEPIRLAGDSIKLPALGGGGWKPKGTDECCVAGTGLLLKAGVVCNH